MMHGKLVDFPKFRQWSCGTSSSFLGVTRVVLRVLKILNMSRTSETHTQLSRVKLRHSEWSQYAMRLFLGSPRALNQRL